MINAPIQSPLLSAPTVKHGFFGRQGGYSDGIFSSLNVSLSKGDREDSVLKNHQKIASQIQCDPNRLIFMQQIHSNTVYEYDQHEVSTPTADATITQQHDMALCVQTADCVPLLLYDPKTSHIGAIHAGWKGALSGVIKNTVEVLKARGVNPKDVIVAMGPCIHQASYQVDQKFYDAHITTDPGTKPFFKHQNEHWYYDLKGYCRHQISVLGIENCDDLNVDTYSNTKDFFSCRRALHNQEPSFGNQISLIMLSGC